MRTPAGERRFDFLTLLCLLLLGYAAGGKAFAYLGHSPVFVGEAVLLAGTAAFILRARRWHLLASGVLAPLAMLLAWGAARLAADVAEHGWLALRDAAIWGYGWFAVLVYLSLVAKPWRLGAMLDRFAGFARYGPALMAAMWLLNTVAEVITVSPLGTRVPLLKGGDLAAHAAGITAFLYLRLRPVPAVWLIGPAALCVMGLNTRAGILGVMVSLGVLYLLRPVGRKATAVISVFAVAAVTLALFDFRFTIPGTVREVSVGAVGEGMESLFRETGTQHYDGTRRWRLLWWEKIYSYTVEGDYFWTGKGFGPNLAESDGFTLDSGNALRSPHSAHLTMLARGGVPGFLLWAAAQLFWGAGMLRTYLWAGRRGEQGWARLSLFLLVYWIAFLVVASFDVFLEGPMAGIWFWTIYGAGLAVMELSRCAHRSRLRARFPGPAFDWERQRPAGCAAGN